MQTVHRFIIIALLACFFTTSDSLSTRPHGGRRNGGGRRSSSRAPRRWRGAGRTHRFTPRRVSGRGWRYDHRRWGTSSSILLGLGAGYWASSYYYRPWDCDYSPNYGLWYFRRTHAWYARPYGCWFYWDLPPAYNNRPVLVIERDKTASELWFAVYTNEGNTMVQHEAPRQLTKRENKHLFNNRSACDIIVISRNKKALGSKLTAEEQRSSKLYIVQAGAVDKQKAINRDSLAKTRLQINNNTLEKQEASQQDTRLQHAHESLEIDTLVD